MHTRPTIAAALALLTIPVTTAMAVTPLAVFLTMPPRPPDILIFDFGRNNGLCGGLAFVDCRRVAVGNRDLDTNFGRYFDGGFHIGQGGRLYGLGGRFWHRFWHRFWDRRWNDRDRFTRAGRLRARARSVLRRRRHTGLRCTIGQRDNRRDGGLDLRCLYRATVEPEAQRFQHVAEFVG